MFFELLTGEKPFRGNVNMVLHQALTDDPPGPRQLSPEVPRDLNTLCLKCLQKDPNQRFGSAEELRAELKRYLEGRPIKTRHSGPIVRAYRWSLRNPSTAILSLALVLALVITSVVSTSAYFDVRHHQRIALLESTELELDRGLNLCEKGEVEAGLRWFAQSLDLARQSSSPLLKVIQANQKGWNPLHSNLLSSTTHLRTVTCLQVFADSERYASGSEDGTLHWNWIGDQPSFAISRRPVVFELGSPITAIAISPNDQWLAAACEDGQVRVWNVHSQSLRWQFTHQERVNSLDFSSDARRLLTGCMDTFARQWDLETGVLIGQPLYHATAIRMARYVGQDQQVLLVGGDRGTLWNLGDPHTPLMTLQHPAEITAQQLAKDKQLLITGSRRGDDQGEVRIWNLENGQTLHDVRPLERAVSAVAISPDNRQAIAGDQGGQVCLWSLANNEVIKNGQWHNFEVRCAQFSDDSSWVATGSFDGKTRVWNTSDALQLGSD